VSQPDAPDRPELLKLYELTLQEYRFQVLLNWDRMKNVFVVDGVLTPESACVDHRPRAKCQDGGRDAAINTSDLWG
jgi:hypothetical protein